MERTFSKVGICEICGKEVAVRQMLKHVKACRQANPLPEKRHQEIFTLRVTSPEYPGYFLYVEVEGEHRLALVDVFLRGIWLECCGHVSQFTIDRKIYCSYVDADMRLLRGNISDMCVRLIHVLKQDMVFHYEYARRLTTDLKLEVVAVRKTKESLPKGFLLVARNLNPAIQCSECQAPAMKVLLDYFEEHCAYCDDCANRFTDEHIKKMLPIVNSPRMGLCGYKGEEEELGYGIDLQSKEA